MPRNLIEHFIYTLRRLSLRYLNFVALVLVIGSLFEAYRVITKAPGAKERFIEAIAQRSDIALAIITIVSVAVAVIQFMLHYLKSDSEPAERSSRFESYNMMARLIRLEKSGVGLSPTDRTALVEEMRTDAASQISEKFLKDLDQKYGPAFELMKKAEYVRSAADRMLDRLKTEIRALMRRGNLNLVIGTTTTVIAAGVLAYVALTITFGADDWRRYLSTFAMRLSIVVFIEIFAFFFLKLYRTTLIEIKYFQNEITNLEAKCLALELATLSNDQAATTKVIEELAKTERNFKLNKDETTVELEKARMDSQQIRDLITAVKDIVPAARGKSASG